MVDSMAETSSDGVEDVKVGKGGTCSAFQMFIDSTLLALVLVCNTVSSLV